MPAIVTYQKENRKAPLLQAKITRFKTQKYKIQINPKIQFPKTTLIAGLLPAQTPPLERTSTRQSPCFISGQSPISTSRESLHQESTFRRLLHRICNDTLTLKIKVFLIFERQELRFVWKWYFWILNFKMCVFGLVSKTSDVFGN